MDRTTLVKLFTYLDGLKGLIKMMRNILESVTAFYIVIRRFSGDTETTPIFSNGCIMRGVES